MSFVSFLLYVVFAAIGYVVYPILLPTLVDYKLVSKSSLSDSYKDKLFNDANVSGDGSSGIEGDESDKNSSEPDLSAESNSKTPEELEAAERLKDQEMIDTLKASVKAGDVEEFKYNQVLEWKRVANEEIDGENYEVGMVSYVVKTIFAEKELNAKALVKDGQVVKWLCPITNTVME